jgi:hypothetical protein
MGFLGVPDKETSEEEEPFTVNWREFTYGQRFKLIQPWLTH